MTTLESAKKDALWLAGVSIIVLTSLLSSSSYIASVPFLQEEWGISNTQSGVLFSAYLVGYALSSLVLLPLTDRVAPGRMMIAGVGLMTAVNLLFPLLAHDFGTGAMLRFVAGMGFVTTYIPGIRLVSGRYAGGRRGTAVGLFVAAGYGGTTSSYTLMGLLLNQTTSWREAYFFTALPGVAALLLALLLVRDGGSVAMGSGNGRLQLTVLRSRPVRLAIIAYALHTAELYLARLWLPLLMGAAFMLHGMAAAEAAAQAATLSGFIFMLGIAGVFSGGMLSDHLGRTRGATLVLLLSGVVSFVIGWLLHAPLVVLIVIGFVYGFATAADSAIYSTAVIELAPAGQIGSAQAAQSFIGFGVGAIVPIVAGSILDVAQGTVGWGLAFSINGLLAVAGMAALRQLKKSR